MRTYTVCCHGCGHVREHVAIFISSPRSWSCDLPNGSRLVIPCWGCSDCAAVPNRIADAYTNGPSPEAWVTFLREAPLWTDRIFNGQHRRSA